MSRRTGSSRAAVRATVLLGTVLDLPVVATLLRLTTREPRLEALSVDGVPVEVVRPGAGGPWPTFVFVNGAHPLRRREPVVWRLSHGLARAGYLAVVPDLPGLGEGRITRATLDATVDVCQAALERDDVRDGRIALVGASTGASLALLAASRPEIADRISLVAAIVPFADLERMVCLATTHFYEEQGSYVPYKVTDLAHRIAAGSLLASLDRGQERDHLLAELTEMEINGLDPLEELPLREDLSPKAQALVSLLANRDPHRFRELRSALAPEVGSLLHDLSPASTVHSMTAHVEIVVPPADAYFPLGEALTLVRLLPNARLTVTRALDHTRPSFTVGHLRDFARLGGFVIRGLARAAS